MCVCAFFDDDSLTMPFNQLYRDVFVMFLQPIAGFAYNEGVICMSIGYTDDHFI